MHAVTSNLRLYKRSRSLSSRHRHSEESISDNIGQLVRDSVGHKAIAQTALVFWTRRSYFTAILTARISYSFKVTIQLYFTLWSSIRLVRTYSALIYWYLWSDKDESCTLQLRGVVSLSISLRFVSLHTYEQQLTFCLYYPRSVTSGTEHSEKEDPSLNSSLANAYRVLGKSYRTKPGSGLLASQSVLLIPSTLEESGAPSISSEVIDLSTESIASSSTKELSSTGVSSKTNNYLYIFIFYSETNW